MIDLEIGAGQGPALPADGVLDGGVRLQGHLPGQAVPEHGRDERALLGHHGLALHDGGQGEELMRAQTARLRPLHDVRA